jgi:hypothetical protein
MDFSEAGGAPSLPLPLLFQAGILLAIPMFLSLKTVQGNAARFVIIAVWLRYMMSAFHTVTFSPLLGGLSWNAIASIAITLTGLYLVRPRDLLLKSLFPVYAIIILMLLSAAANAGIGSAINSIIKHVYFAVMMIAVYRALKENDGARFFTPFLSAFAPLLVFQLLSVALGNAKASELDGSVSYIGGYNHEAAFSIALATFFVVASLAVNIPRLIKPILLMVLVAGIALANYRTTLLALLPFAAVQLMNGATLSFVRRQRVFVGALLSILALFLILQLTAYAPERFSDLAVFIEDPSKFIKPQAEFSFDDRRLMSGRAYIWSGYIFTWIDGSMLNHLLGFGPDSWPNWFKVYPHNTAVAYLFELGLIGFFLLLLFWGIMLRLAMRARGYVRVNLIFAHIAFIFMNLATMALWQIEGVIFYAIVCGYSLFSTVEAGAFRRELKLNLRPA